MQSTDKTKPTHTDYLQLKKTTELNLRGLNIERAVLDRTLQYATEMEEKTRPKDYQPDEEKKHNPLMQALVDCDKENNPEPTPKPRPIPEDVKKLSEDNSGDESHRKLGEMKCKKPTQNTPPVRA